MIYFLLTNTINKISLYIVDIKMHFYYFIFYISQKYFIVLKNILYMKKSASNQVITLNISVMTLKKSLVIAIPNIRFN